MNNDDVFALIAIERGRVADMFESLGDSQWSTRTLCGEWTVRDLAGHLIAPFCISIPRFVIGLVTAGGFDRFNAKAARDLARRPTAELVAKLRENSDSRFTPPGNGPLAPLTDVTVHTRDAARPLGLDVSAPLDTWRAVLDFLTSPPARRAFVPGSRLDGIALRATDQEWQSGAGAEVRGSSEALALAMAGRSAALGDLEGDGVPILAGRLR